MGVDGCRGGGGGGGPCVGLGLRLRMEGVDGERRFEVEVDVGIGGRRSGCEGVGDVIDERVVAVVDEDDNEVRSC